MSEIAAWVPAPILVAALIFGGKWLLAKVEARFARYDALVEQAKEFATTKQLGNMGDRFDARHAALREDVVRLEERCSKRGRR